MLLVMKRLNTLHKIVSLNLVIIIVYQKNIGKKCCFGCEKEQKEKKIIERDWIEMIMKEIFCFIIG